MYALLARLEKPLHRDEASLLRGLLRELCYLRSKVDVSVGFGSGVGVGDHIVSATGAAGAAELNTPATFASPKELTMLNVLIVIVGIYFEQSSSSDCIMNLE